MLIITSVGPYKQCFIETSPACSSNNFGLNVGWCFFGRESHSSVSVFVANEHHLISKRHMFSNFLGKKNLHCLE